MSTFFFGHLNVSKSLILPHQVYKEMAGLKYAVLVLKKEKGNVPRPVSCSSFPAKTKQLCVLLYLV
jgi:hypothetical protein